MIAFLLLYPPSVHTARDLGPQDPVCLRLRDHLGARHIDRLNASRPQGAMRLSEVCRRVAQEARRQSLDPAIAVAIAYGESRLRWDPPGGRYMGPMQVGRRWCKRPEAGCVPDGVAHLLHWRQRTASWDEALWGYVGGNVRNLSAQARRRKRNHVAAVKQLIGALSEPLNAPPSRSGDRAVPGPKPALRTLTR